MTRRQHRLLLAGALIAGVVVMATSWWWDRDNVPDAGPPALTVQSAHLAASDQLSAGYLVITNSGGGDELLAASSPAADRVTLHGSGMEPVDTYEIPAGGTLTLAPAQGHLMFEGLTEPLLDGAQVTVKLQFARSAEMTVQAEVLTYAEIGEQLVDAGGQR